MTVWGLNSYLKIPFNRIVQLKYMDIGDIKNHIQVSDRIASSGQPADRQFRRIAEKRFGLTRRFAYT